MVQFDDILYWSLYWLWRGLWPDKHWDGTQYEDPNSIEFQRALTPLADGFYSLLWAIRCDREFESKRFKLPSAGARNPCGKCACEMFAGATIPWTDWSDGAKWRDTVYTFMSFLLLFHNVHKIFTLPGGSGYACSSREIEKTY